MLNNEQCDAVGFEYPAFLVSTLSFNKFYIWSNVENEDIAIHCSVCGRTETVSSRLDDLVEWAEQHDCPVEFKGPP